MSLEEDFLKEYKKRVNKNFKSMVNDAVENIEMLTGVTKKSLVDIPEFIKKEKENECSRKSKIVNEKWERGTRTFERTRNLRHRIRNNNVTKSNLGGTKTINDYIQEVSPKEAVKIINEKQVEPRWKELFAQLIVITVVTLLMFGLIESALRSI